MPLQPLLRSFWIGGFEGADHRDGRGVPLDMAAANGHHRQFDEDYAAAATLGLRCVRESIGWRLGEPAPRRYRFDRTLAMARSARRRGVQIWWTLMHYGTPHDLDLRDDAFIERFAAFAAAAARALAPLSDAPLYTPVNEIGFLAWAVSDSDDMWPYRREADRDRAARVGWDVKRRLVRAALAAMRAIADVDPRARFVAVEPLMHVIPARGCEALAPLAAELNARQWQAWDLLAGRLEPELGGHDAALPLIGANLYHSGQWEIGLEPERRLRWSSGPDRDPRRLPSRELLRAAWRRYRKPIVIAETSHFGAGRAAWLTEMAREVACVRDEGAAVEGVCLYPLIDRPDWNEQTRWHHSGLIDVVPPRAAGGKPTSAAARWQRVPDPASLAALARAQRLLPQLEPDPMNNPTLIVFSHLRWNFVWQRPQQILSRLARDRRVVFVEEPVHDGASPRLVRSQPMPGVDVLVPHTPVPETGFGDAQLPLLSRLMKSFVCQQQITDPVAWFYTPLAAPLAAAIEPCTIVYDCMDELSAFRGAPSRLAEREAALLAIADVVLTGGPSLYEARRARHRRVYCLPSAVDGAHFAPARLLHDSTEARIANARQGALPRPRLGFFGVIDERMDLALVAALARARPAWQIVMAGPVVKIDEAALPRAPNLHWLGMQPYAVLPYLAAGWDVCLMPFARNEATRFISPTKTLEYFAAEKPVVSTAVQDVISLYGDVVEIARDTSGFVACCEKVLGEPQARRARRVNAGLEAVWRLTWDDTAAFVRRALDRPRRHAAAAATAATASAAASVSTGAVAIVSVGPDAAVAAS